MFHTPPGVVQVAQPQPQHEARSVTGQERDMSERDQFIQERLRWKAIIDAECARLEIFLRTCSFD